jgi:dipeptidyl-peptidase-4
MKKRTIGLALTGWMFFILSLPAQNIITFQGWVDAEHFVVRDGENQLQVEVRTGRQSPFEKPAEATDYLPEGVRTSRGNTYFSDDRQAVVIDQHNDLFLATVEGKAFRQITGTPAEEQNPTFSPDGRKLAYTRDHNLYVLDLESGLERQLTSDGSEIIYNGYASWVYYEEILGRRSRYKAFYWSPDSRMIAFLRFDDRQVPTFPIFHHEAEDSTHGYLEVTRYPKAGDPPPEVRLGVAHVETGSISWVSLHPDLAYTAGISWTPDSDRLFYQQMNRDQDTLHLYAADPETNRTDLIYEETQPTWVTFFDDIHFMGNESGFLLRSNSDGWYNLYHYDRAGTLINQVTDFNWRVTELLYIDEERKRVFFMGTGEDATQEHLFSIRLDGSDLKQLTRGEGTHRVELSPDATYFYDHFSSYDQPGVQAVYDGATGALLHELNREKQNPNAERGIKVSFFTIPSTDGFELPAYWVLPPDFDENKQYPVVFSIYGGPDAGSVYNRFRDFSRDELVNAGVILFAVDHRGSGKFGKKGLDYMHRNLGKWEMHDYIEAVKWLKEQPFVDGQRIGIQGGSYGGYMAAMALTCGADHFSFGVSRAPVTDWRLYDNVYTERYMDTPRDNPEGYAFGSVMTHADQLQGKLLLLHGTIDDNVHLQNTIHLVSKLQDLGKDFDLMLYPGGRHGWGGAKRIHSTDLAKQFWMEYLVGN